MQYTFLTLLQREIQHQSYARVFLSIQTIFLEQLHSLGKNDHQKTCLILCLTLKGILISFGDFKIFFVLFDSFSDFLVFSDLFHFFCIFSDLFHFFYFFSALFGASWLFWALLVSFGHFSAHFGSFWLFWTLFRFFYSFSALFYCVCLLLAQKWVLQCKIELFFLLK